MNEARCFDFLHSIVDSLAQIRTKIKISQHACTLELRIIRPNPQMGWDDSMGEQLVS